MVSFRKPVTFILKKQGEKLYSIDGDPGFLAPDNEALMKLGTYMEYFFTN